MLKKVFIFTVLVFACYANIVNAQKQTLDKIVGLVSNYPIYLSDVDGSLLYLKQSTPTISQEKAKCTAFENILLQKFLYYQSQVDSISVSDAEIEAGMDDNIRQESYRAGSKEKLEEFLGKSIEQYKIENRKSYREQVFARKEQGKVVQLVKITPNEVSEFFNSLKPEEVPEIPAMYEIAQITKTPVLGASQQKEARTKLNSIKERIKKGEKFETLAILYSEDPSSASKGGELGYFGKRVMAPEFESAAYGLKNPGDLSEVIKTKFGYHLLQLIGKKGASVNVRHILIIPKVSPEDLAKAKFQLDSISDLIKEKKTTFEDALKLSDHPGKINGGLLTSTNPNNTNPLLSAKDIEPRVFFDIEKLQPGEFTKPLNYLTEDNTEGYRILYLKKRIPAHKANLKDDYDFLQELAKEEKSKKVMAKWVEQRAKNTYIKINDEYKNCTFNYKWVFVEN